MKSGICYPSYARSVVWTTAGAAWQADFPATNLAKLDEPRRVGVANAGATDLIGTLAANRMIDFVALIHHNLPPAAAVVLTVYSDAARTVVVFTGPILIPPAVAGGYPLVVPIRLPAAVNARAIKIAVPNTGGETVVGGVEIGLFWEWNVEVPRAIGIDTRSSRSDVGGTDHVTGQWSPRVVTGSRELVAQDEVETTFLDFQNEMGLAKAFVWCWDVTDAATWTRETMLVTNNALPPASSPEWDVGRMTFSFREQLR